MPSEPIRAEGRFSRDEIRRAIREADRDRRHDRRVKAAMRSEGVSAVVLLRPDTLERLRREYEVDDA